MNKEAKTLDIFISDVNTSNDAGIMKNVIYINPSL